MTTPLIVPVQIKAYLVNEGEYGSDHRRWSLDNSRPEDYLSTPIEPSPLVEADSPDPGVYVQWSLPDALRAMRDQSDGEATFPLVPNRWLVARFSRPKGTPEASLTAAWVVDSDFLDDGDVGESPYLVTTPDNRLEGRWIGRARDITGAEPQQWAESGDELFLSGVGPGLLAFAGYQPYHENVFSYHDDLGDLTDSIDELTLDYLVVGWYSRGDKDILANPGDTPLAELLKDLGWEPEPGGQEPDEKSLYMGTALRVESHGDGPPASDRPDDPGSVFLAVGNNTADAQQALMSDRDAALGRLFHAFLTDNFEQLDEDPDGLDDVVHRTWFHTRAAGHVWEITNAPDASGQPDQAELEIERGWLAELNDKQRRYDIAARSAAALRQRLYDLWRLKHTPEAAQQAADFNPDEKINQLGDHVQALLEEMQNILSTDGGLPTGDTTDELNRSVEQYAAARKLPAYRRLKCSALPSFYTPADPVILFGGLNAEAPPKDGGAALRCRTADQLVSQIRIDGVMWGPYLAAPAWYQDALGRLPEEIRETVEGLITECSLLALAAATGNAPDDDALTQDLADPDRIPVTFMGTPAPFTSRWRQPWAPVFVEWRMHYYPIPFVVPGEDHDNCYCWQFDAETGRYRLHTRGRPSPVQPQQLTGRCAVTSLPVFITRARAEQHARRYPDAPGQALEALAETGELGQLSQTLEDFNLSLQQRTAAADALPRPRDMTPDGRHDLNDLLRRRSDLGLTAPGHGLPLPDPDQREGSDPDRRGSHGQVAPLRFNPVRAGQFVFTEFVIVDAFGRSLEFNPSHGAFSRSIHVTPDNDITVGGSDQTDPNLYIQLPPRILQPTQLRFDFVDALNRDLIVGDPPVIGTAGERAPSPVVGWLLANHLTGSLLVYDPEGHGVVEGRLGLAPDGSQKVDWDSLPDCRYHPLDTQDEGFTDAWPELSGFLQGLRGGPDRPGFDPVTAFKSLMEHIDRSAQSTKPSGDDGDMMAPLVGKPIALLRARLTLETDSPYPFTDTSWKSVEHFPTPPYLDVSHTWRWNILLGAETQYADGLIGYYTHPPLDDKSGNPVDTTKSTDYSVLRTVLQSTAQDAESPYTQHIDARDLALPVNPGPVPDVLPRDGSTPTAAYVTLLADPRRTFQATTDIVPAVTLRLPDEFVRDALSNLRLAFRMGPLLASTRPAPDPSPESGAISSTQGGDDAPTTAVTMPSISAWAGTWNWSQRGRQAGRHDWETYAIAHTDPTAHLDQETPTARTGYLTLTTALGQTKPPEDDTPSPSPES
ncbi:hypothetical protein [Streptomyces lonegramiae]|uniref:Uncharacterized protein n=1 Tax=Streptomyces lonegramiae TaxID=3075524 RepID=A0ABU2XPV6_9ACTN|nr:hypothetical protein [Streptomyces sp. DSM 41529]MDT0547484.1 hypothetical protein [Streptomyces sp. DSM 41529]